MISKSPVYKKIFREAYKMRGKKLHLFNVASGNRNAQRLLI